MNRDQKFLARIFFWGAAIALLALFFSISQHDGSRSRLLVSGLLLLECLAWLGIAAWVWRKPVWQEKLIDFAEDTFWGLVITFSIILGLGWLAFFLPEYRAIEILGGYSGYLLRLQPIALYGLLFSLGFVPLIVGWRYSNAQRWNDLRPEFRATLISLLALLGLGTLIGLTGFGLGFDQTVWNAPGTPILFPQVLLVTVFAALLYWGSKTWGAGFDRADLFLFLTIWILAAGLWLAQPNATTYFNVPLNDPNFEAYPRSDAFNHDVIAQNLLIGKGFIFGGLRVVRKPIYAFFMAGLHLLTGSDYKSMITIQVIVLALFPALLYLIGKRIHHRMTGLVLAGIIILREVNAFHLADVINSVHVKLQMVAIFAAIGVGLVAYLLMRWLQAPERHPYLPLWFGGMMGVTALIRSQNVMLIPAVSLLIFIALFRNWRQMAQVFALAALGGLLTLAPFVARNYGHTELLIIEHSGAAPFLANRYSDEPIDAFLPGESEADAYQRLMGIVSDGMAADPGQTVYDIGSNYVRNVLLSVMYFPNSFTLHAPEQYARELIFWPSWDGSIPLGSVLPVLLNLALMAIGLAAAWRRFRWAGMVPLFINLGFNLSLAWARVSGWRYSIPGDWTMAVYYAMGIVQLIIWSGALLGKDLDEKQELTTDQPALFAWRGLVMPVLTLAVIGFAMPAVEYLSTPKYPALSREDVIFAVEEADVNAGQRDMAIALLAQPGLTVGQGEALYPIFYKAGEGVEDSKFPGEVPYPFAHLYFYLIGYDQVSIILPWEDGGLEFPHGQEVFVVGCNQNSIYWQASMVLVRSETGDQLFFASDEGLSCP